MREPSIQVRALGKLRKAALEAGLPERALAALDPRGATALDDDRDARVPVADLLTLWERIVAQLPRTDLPLLAARQYDVADYQLLGFLCMSSASVGAALSLLARFQPLWNEGGSWALRAGDPFVVGYRMIAPGRRGSSYSSASGLVEAVQGMRAVIGVELPLRAVRLGGDVAWDAGAYEGFFRAPVHVRAAAFELELAPEAAALPLRKADPALCAFLHAHAERALAALRAESELVRAVRQAVVDQLIGGTPGIARAARALATSARTLRRQLAAEATSFRAIVDDVRHQLAVQYLRDPALGAAEVAFLLGFSEAAAFHRAFKRWTGTTPHAFRRGGGSALPTPAR
jgi:AraC-like DNA-binding protein